ncbi:tyrosine-type recombinase/integrase [Microbacterium aurantiacum]|uniref:tyrosine-type recombinase/integrase n=3 Tax=Microbacterium aurantiacum TaxID=162393 RepID=UPI004035EDB1
MTLIVETAEAPGSQSGSGWRDFLAGMLNEEWVVGAWDAATGILTVDPFNELNDFRACRRPGCANPASRVDYCPPCQRRARHAGVSVEEYARTHPKVSLDARRTTRGFELCGISDEAGVRCGRAMTTRGLCPTHYDLFAKRCKQSDAALTDHRLEAFVADRVGKVVFPSVPCPIASCGRILSHSISSGLCDYHDSGLRAARRKQPALTVEDFMGSNVVLERHQLALGSLSEPLRTELLFVIQQYADRGVGRVMISKLRPFINDVAADRHTDLLECFRSHEHSVRLKGLRAVGILLLEKAHRQFEGYDSLRGDLIFLQDLPLRETQSARNPDLGGTPLDIRKLTQPWLADAFRTWLGATLEPRGAVRKCFDVCAEASQVMAARRSDAGTDPTRLSYEDMAAIIARFEQRWSAQGIKFTYSVWWELCRLARRFGVWDEIPESFAQNYAAQKRRTLRGKGDQKVESDRVTPAAVVAHLRSHTDQLDIGRPSDMYRCVLELLMETGRRPAEIATLRTDCLVQDRHGGWLLRYTAHKTGGATKELPVETPVVESIRRWERIRTERGIRSSYLFPSGRRRLQDENIPPIGERYLGKILHKFAANLPQVPGPVTDADGHPVDFDLTTVQPYDFRRAYAQRHADNGTDPDVLRQLMDHVSLSTTMGYYQVSSKRRRKAVNTLAPLAHDRHGRQVGIANGRMQLKITPVPYGDCAEPSNVAAGGTACQLRYQCAGCGFFRPNPSHIPEIEKEIMKLKSQLRIAEASDTAGYLLDAQRGLIADYEKVLTTMRERLEQLPQDQRREISTMSEVMRRARSAALAGKHIELREI